MKQLIFLKNIKNSAFFITLFNWEYWPMWLTNIPVVFIWLWFALRARKLFFFTAVNPVIETGGVLGESKINILNRIPNEVLPKTIFVSKDADFQGILMKMKSLKLAYPIIAKPNIGERGLLVTKIDEEVRLKNYFQKNKIDFLIQEFVDLPYEWAVMHHRLPDSNEGQVTSICIKEPLSIMGDGIANIRTLMRQKPRAVLQLNRFEKDAQPLLNQIPKKGETIELEPIGNHCRGTKFLNGNHLIDEQLNATFNQIAAQMDGIYYGRFDMKCASPDAVKKGDFKVLEYNGIAAEPAHIYDPTYPLSKKYQDIYQHWKIIFKIYKIQQAKGEKSMSWSEMRASYKTYSNYMKSLTS
ncbi:MAG: hypothetical protein NXI23_01575 [Bacteroidetes bacterium]|jgi:hypothetical protein|nr:hypothetical protein [Bacteroidota bacterium]